MPKRRRLLTPMKKRASVKSAAAIIDKEASTPRGRLKGALLDALDTPAGDDSDDYKDTSPARTPEPNRSTSPDDNSYRRAPSQQSYVLKLFDRSVDLSQFQETSPLYPICRAWMANQPKADYRKFGKKYDIAKVKNEVDLPGPEGPVVSRIPQLLPEQQMVNKDNIDLNYEPDSPLPSHTELLQSHLSRWSGVRAAWVQQATKAEARYKQTQAVLTSINANAI